MSDAWVTVELSLSEHFDLLAAVQHRLRICEHAIEDDPGGLVGHHVDLAERLRKLETVLLEAAESSK